MCVKKYFSYISERFIAQTKERMIFMYKNYFKYSQEIYLVNLEEGYCTFSFNDHHQKVYADPTILQELQRSQWKEEKRKK